LPERAVSEKIFIEMTTRMVFENVSVVKVALNMCEVQMRKNTEIVLYGL